MSDHDHKAGTADIGCLEAINALYEYLDGELDNPELVAEFEQHLSHCRSCFTRAEAEKLLTDRIRKSAENHAPSELRSRLGKLMDEF